MRKSLQSLKRQFYRQQVVGIVVIVIVAGIGTYFLVASHAATPFASSEAEAGTLSGASTVQDPNASNGSAVKFGSGSVSTASCKFITIPTATPAFCDDFSDETNIPAVSRSGPDLGEVWGVSRSTEDDNIGQGAYFDWAGVNFGATSDNLNGPATICGAIKPVIPDSDVQICQGELVDSMNDDSHDTDAGTLLAMYPRQPFDFAGRTGIVEFDVSDNTEGTHAAWPAFTITDQPVPAPWAGNGSVPGVIDAPRNSFGVSLGGVQQPVPPPSGSQAGQCVGVDQMWSVSNYAATNVSFNSDGCVQESPQTGGLGDNNHVEIQISTTSVKVYMSDAGTTTMKLVADATLNLSFSRGLVWMEDVHYGADKFNQQATNSLSWDNFAFDGPVEPRDLGFDVPDNTKASGTTDNGINQGYSIGYNIPGGGGTLPLTIQNVNNVANVVGSNALLEFTYRTANGAASISAAVNGNAAVSFPWPAGYSGNINGGTGASDTAAIAVPIADIHNGSNSVVFSTSDSGGADIANIDLILPGAGGVVNP